MATIAYLLCAVLSVACAALLVRAWSHDRRHLLLWTGVCFAWLGISNVLLFVDLSLLGFTVVYLARALAFGLILVAIADKNLARRRPPRVHR